MSLPNSHVKPFGEGQRMNSWTFNGRDSYLDPHTAHHSFVSKEYPHQFTTFESLCSRSLRDVSFHVQQAKECEWGHYPYLLGEASALLLVLVGDALPNRDSRCLE